MLKYLLMFGLSVTNKLVEIRQKQVFKLDN